MEKKTDIQFSIIQNGSNLSPEGQALREKIYDLWHPLWTQIYKSWGSTNVPNIRDFRLYEIIHCIMVNGQVAGISAHRFMKTTESLNKHLEYFESFGEENIQKLLSWNVRNIMTFESLLVSPDFRKSHNDMNISKVLTYLANQTFAKSHADGLVGTARIDVKVPRLGYDVGYETIEADRKVRVIPCDLIVQRNRELFHPQDHSWKLAQSLWEARTVYQNEDPFQVGSQHQQQIKKAA